MDKHRSQVWLRHELDKRVGLCSWWEGCCLHQVSCFCIKYLVVDFILFITYNLCVINGPFQRKEKHFVLWSNWPNFQRTKLWKHSPKWRYCENHQFLNPHLQLRCYQRTPEEKTNKCVILVHGVAVVIEMGRWPADYFCLFNNIQRMAWNYWYVRQILNLHKSAPFKNSN